jgi:hypothetical protein
MIHLLQIKRSARFVARLRFSISGKPQPEAIEIDHRPASDPVRTYAAEGDDMNVAVQIITPPRDRLEIKVLCKNGPLFVVVDGAGLRLFTLP